MWRATKHPNRARRPTRSSTPPGPPEYILTWASEREPRPAIQNNSPAVSLAVDLESHIVERVRRVPSLVRSVLRWTGQRLEVHNPLHSSDRQQVINRLFPEAATRRQFLTRFVALMALSVALASLGILADSTAVVIGAMLVAPFMGPVLGMAAALTMAWPRRVISQGGYVALGACLGVGLAWIISYVIPAGTDPLPVELLARTSPNLLDLGIAMAAGAAGAYAQVRRHASDALPGVAVAVALVPPLAASGIALEMGAWKLSHGALVLFAINVVGVVVSASLTFIASGFVPGWRLMTGNSSIAIGLRLAAVAVALVVVPLQFGRDHLLPPSDRTAEVVAAVHEFVDSRPADVVDISIGADEEFTDVDVVVAGTLPSPLVNALANHVAERIGTPVSLELRVIEATSASATVSLP